MSEVNFFFDLIPDFAYKYILMGLVLMLVFKNRIPILNKIDVKFHFSEDFMRSFRWITPLLVFISLVFQFMNYLLIREVLKLVGSRG